MKQPENTIMAFIKKNWWSRVGLAFVLVGLVIAGVLIFQLRTSDKPIPLSSVAEAISAGRVLRIEDTLKSGALTIYYKDGSQHLAQRDQTAPFLEQMHYLGVSDIQLAQLEYEIVQPSQLNVENATNIILIIMFFGLAGFAIVRYTGGGMLAIRKKYVQGDVPNTTFNDVAGVEECREELGDIVAFLKDNALYQRMGASMPRGVLLVGEPGTGKTLLARAIAGEAGVPFFTTSGSEFVEMYVGVGASRVRSLFKQARAKAPCIIFIDEIDAVGRKRHSGAGGGEMEQDQTLNQILVEMDGFTPSEGVVVLAATNRIDVLDPALTRSGRFDRHVNVPRPDIKGRLAILDVHVKSRRLAPEVNLLDVAKSTPGLVGADLANIVNEAAILAVRDGHAEITVQDFQEAVEKSLTGGTQQKSRVINANERRTIAYHEAGHAVGAATIGGG